MWNRMGSFAPPGLGDFTRTRHWYIWYNALLEETNVRSGNCYPANASGPHPLFTVGHSILEFENFAALLKDHGVELVVDVRTVPQSARLPQFSLPGFEKLLRAEHLEYLFLGEELGGRPDDADAYRPDGVVDYLARRKSYAFQAGLDRLWKELEGRLGGDDVRGGRPVGVSSLSDGLPRTDQAGNPSIAHPQRLANRNARGR